MQESSDANIDTKVMPDTILELVPADLKEPPNYTQSVYHEVIEALTGHAFGEGGSMENATIVIGRGLPKELSPQEMVKLQLDFKELIAAMNKVAQNDLALRAGHEEINNKKGTVTTRYIARPKAELDSSNKRAQLVIQHTQSLPGEGGQWDELHTRKLLVSAQLDRGVSKKEKARGFDHLLDNALEATTIDQTPIDSYRFMYIPSEGGEPVVGLQLNLQFNGEVRLIPLIDRNSQQGGHVLRPLNGHPIAAGRVRKQEVLPMKKMPENTSGFLTRDLADSQTIRLIDRIRNKVVAPLTRAKK